MNKETVQALMALRGKFAPGMVPTIGPTTFRVAVIRIDFPDKPMSKTKNDTQVFFDRLRTYYLENSYDLVTVEAVISDGGSGSNGAFRMPGPLSSYANGSDSNYKQLAQDAIAVALSHGFDFLSVQHVMFYHAGNGAETTGNEDIWSVFTPEGYLDGPNVNGKVFPGATFVPESEGMGIDPLGVICHEYGHQLGLPDLYNTVSKESAIGDWSLMDSGSYLGSPRGSNPAHLDAWSKQFLRFSSPETICVTPGLATSLARSELEKKAFIKVPINPSVTPGTTEYFLLEFRSKTGGNYDNDLPGEGLLIWHVDESIVSDPLRLFYNQVNVGDPHHGVSLVEADNSNPEVTGADSGDPWPGSTNNQFFGTPKSDSFSGQKTEFSIEMLSFSTTSMHLNLKNPLSPCYKVGPPEEQTAPIPNPFFAESNGNAKVTFWIPRGLGKEVQTVRIFNGAGVLVRNLSSSNIWDGKNDYGETVASGVYIYELETALGRSKSKFILIR